MTIYLAHPMAWALGLPSPDRAGRRRCCHRGQAANPGTGRTPMVPLFGLAPGGVWPSLRHRKRPDALTVRFHPYPPEADGMFLCHFPSPITASCSSGPGSYPAPCPAEPGLSSPQSASGGPGGGHPVNVDLSQIDSSITQKEGQAEQQGRCRPV